MPSKETKELDLLYREVGLMSNNFGMKLVQTREKLKPFCDEGVVHKDRKVCTKKKQEENNDRKKDPKLEARICEYKERIKELLEDTNVYGLEKVVKELTQDLDDDADIDYISESLRL